MFKKNHILSLICLIPFTVTQYPSISGFESLILTPFRCASNFVSSQHPLQLHPGLPMGRPSCLKLGAISIRDVHTCSNRRKFGSQISDNMERLKTEVKRVRERKKTEDQPLSQLKKTMGYHGGPSSKPSILGGYQQSTGT